MSPTDRIVFERVQVENDATPIRQILAELLAQHRLLPAETKENRAPNVTWRRPGSLGQAA
jgi:hypothetical protein